MMARPIKKAATEWLYHIHVFMIVHIVIVQGSNDPQPDCFVSKPGMNTVQSNTKTFPIQPLVSHMQVFIENNGPSSAIMCVKCWSGNHDKDQCDCAWYFETKVLSWSFTSGAATKYWCEAAWGPGYWNRQAKIDKFAVFGDDVPKKSSDWKVNRDGKHRYQEDGSPTNARYAAPWIGNTPWP